MMIQVAIALAAGCASALMFASIISGVLFSFILFNLAPLPLMVAALGWGPVSGLVGGLITILLVGFKLNFPSMLAAAITIALPAWWLGHLALLAKPAEHSAIATAQSTLDWYPPGRLLAWTAAFASLTAVTTLLFAGFNEATITDVFKRSVTGIVGLRELAVDSSETDKLVAMLITIAPAGVTMVAMTTLTLNLWLAGKITQTSGRLTRPWPALSTIELPPMTLVALFLAIALCFTGGFVALLSQVIAASLVMGYAFVGLAVIHALTRATAMRGLWLGSTYAAVMFFVWPLFVVVLVGVADTVFRLRQRQTQKLKPPTSSS